MRSARRRDSRRATLRASTKEDAASAASALKRTRSTLETSGHRWGSAHAIRTRAHLYSWSLELKAALAGSGLGVACVRSAPTHAELPTSVLTCDICVELECARYTHQYLDVLALVL